MRLLTVFACLVKFIRYITHDDYMYILASDDVRVRNDCQLGSKHCLTKLQNINRV